MSISGKAEDDRNERKGNDRAEHEQYPVARHCPIGSPSKIDGFLITEKNRQNDPLAATPRVVSAHYTWTTVFLRRHSPPLHLEVYRAFFSRLISES